MLTRIVAIVAMFTLAIPAMVQAAPPAVAQGIVGEVLGIDVNVRCSPSTTGSYACAKVSRPDKVTVVGQKDDWLKILPVKGCYSVIAKQFVRAAGKIGTITGNNVWIRAGGDMCTWTKVQSYWQLQSQVNSGAKVEILGEKGDFYMISPPAGTYYWIFAEYVDLGGKKPVDVEASAIGSERVRITPIRSATTTRPTMKIVAVEPSATEPANTTPLTGPYADLEAAKKAMKAEYAKDLEQRDMDAVIKNFQAINTKDDAYLAKVVDYYVKYMQNQKADIDEAVALKKASDNVDQTITTLKQKNEKIHWQAAAEGDRYYPADGILVASGLFPGDKATPKRWKVTDPDTRRITAYVQCTGGKVDLDQYVNKHVGIKGASYFDKDLGLFIVDAESVKEFPAGGEKLPDAPKAEVTAPPAEEEDPVEDDPDNESVELADDEGSEPDAATTEPDETSTTEPAETEPADTEPTEDEPAAAEPTEDGAAPIE